MAGRREPWDSDPFAFNGNVRTPYELSPADEAWWQEYGVAIEAFRDKVRPRTRKPLPPD